MAWLIDEFMCWVSILSKLQFNAEKMLCFILQEAGLSEHSE
jgi:hypothetical protein